MRARPVRLALRLLLVALMSGIGAAPTSADSHAAAQKKDELFAFGEAAVYRKCLIMTAMHFKNGSGNMSTEGWVTLTVENRCGHAVGGVRAALVLVDREGAPFGADLWLLEPGMVLRPGATWQDRYSIPGADGRIAQRWTVRVISARGFPRSPRRAKKSG